MPFIINFFNTKSFYIPSFSRNTTQVSQYAQANTVSILWNWINYIHQIFPLNLINFSLYGNQIYPEIISNNNYWTNISIVNKMSQVLKAELRGVLGKRFKKNYHCSKFLVLKSHVIKGFEPKYGTQPHYEPQRHRKKFSRWNSVVVAIKAPPSLPPLLFHHH